MRKVLFAIALTVSCGLAACDRSPPPPPVAVNDTSLTLEDILDEAAAAADRASTPDVKAEIDAAALMTRSVIARYADSDEDTAEDLMEQAADATFDASSPDARVRLRAAFYITTAAVAGEDGDSTTANDMLVRAEAEANSAGISAETKAAIIAAVAHARDAKVPLPAPAKPVSTAANLVPVMDPLMKSRARLFIKRALNESGVKDELLAGSLFLLLDAEPTPAP
jgi:hypothetical protein